MQTEIIENRNIRRQKSVHIGQVLAQALHKIKTIFHIGKCGKIFVKLLL